MQAGQYWPGSLNQQIQQQPRGSLPTPPGAENPTSLPEQPGKLENHYNMSAAVMHQPHAPTIMDSMGVSSSFGAHKTAVSNVPLPGRIELPTNALTAKFGASVNNTNMMPSHQVQNSINSLLTPPSNIPGDSLSPISNGSQGPTNPASQGLPPFTPNGGWQQPTGTGLTPYFGSSSGTGTTPQPWMTGLPFTFPPSKGLFSPSLGSIMRNNSNSPSVSGGLPPPPPNYDMSSLPPFMSTGPLPPTSSFALAPQTAQPQQTQQPVSQFNFQPLSAAAPLQPHGNSYPPPNANPTSPPDYMRAPPTPATPYYGSQPSSTPQQPTFASYTTASPPLTSPQSRISPSHSSHQTSSFPPPHLPPSQQPLPQARPYVSYPPPQNMNMMSSAPAGSPQQHYSMSAAPMQQQQQHGMPPQPFNSGHAAQMQQMYNSQQAQLAQTERPFKCEQCQQSFNRNHDLKRHKRIHLAVKPFPCGCCEKSFSRKDALKRHILVKGCGKAMEEKKAAEAEADSSAGAKSESGSEDETKAET